MSQFFVSQNSPSELSPQPGKVWPSLASDDPHDRDYIPQAPHGEELIRTSMPIPAFLPWYDEQQNIGETAEIRAAYRQMLKDPNVKAAFLGKLFGVMSQDCVVRPSNKNSKRARKLAKFVEYNLHESCEGGPAGMIWEIMSGALISGFSVCEKLSEVETTGEYRGKRVLTALRSKDVDQDLVVIVNEFGRITGVKGLRYNSGQVWNPKNFLIYKNLGLYGNPTGMSDFRAVYARYWMLDTIIKVRGMAVQKRAIPIVYGTYTDPTKQKSLEASLEALRYRNWISVPAGVQLQVLDIAGQSDAIFSSTCRELREEIFTGISLATLQAMQGGAGTQRGSSIIHKDTADLAKWVVSYAFVHLCNNRKQGLVREIVNWNFNGVDKMPRVALSGVDESELNESLRVDQGLSQLVQQISDKDGNKYQLDPHELEERYGRKLVKVPQQQQQPGGGMPGMGGMMGAAPGSGAPPGAPEGQPGGVDPGIAELMGGQ